jgi:1,4-alpha-glucan branching enzyme
MSIKKQYSKSKSVCKVTFKLDKETASSNEKVTLTGDFNNWDVESIPMKQGKTGDFSVAIELEKGKEYQFRYILDNAVWINEEQADKYVPNEFHSENSVVIV